MTVSGGGGDNSGDSWANAKPGSALFSTLTSGDEIWVAGGVYTMSSSDRITLTQGVQLYGGFAGTETALSQRDFKANVTKLDGEGSSSLPLIYGGTNATPSDTRIDGFTITGGGSGGMYNHTSSPTITNCIFSGNTGGQGAGMYNYNSSPIVTNCTFSSNTVYNSGGGMFNSGSNPTIINCIFSGNTADPSGGGMSNLDNSNPTIINCTFSGNTAVAAGGSVGGGMYSHNSNPIIINCTFSGNTANEGGGMYNGNNAIANTILVNTIFWGNTADISGDEIYVLGPGTITLNHCVIDENKIYVNSLGTPNVIFDDVIIQTNPQLTALDINGNPTTNPASVYIYSISNTSPAIDKGLSVGAVVSASVKVPGTDQRGITRPQFGGVDIGAYEFRVPLKTVY